jgi:hypothetical protein
MATFDGRKDDIDASSADELLAVRNGTEYTWRPRALHRRLQQLALELKT